MILHEVQQKMKAEERASASPFRHSVFVTDYFIAEIYQVIMRIGQMRWGQNTSERNHAFVRCDL
jgi:hypothetical protein